MGRSIQNFRSHRRQLHKTVPTLFPCVWGETSGDGAVGSVLELHRTNSSSNASPIVTSASQLEDFLARRLAVETFGSSSQTDSASSDEDFSDDVVQHAIRYDAHWLSCEPPALGPLMTILGIYEDEGQAKLPVQIHTYSAKHPSSSLTTMTASRAYAPPHSDWKRLSLLTLPDQQAIGNNSDETPYQLSWIDLRSLNSTPDIPFLKSQEEVFNFLSTTLGNQHDSSPWVPVESPQEATSSYANGDFHDAVVLVLPAPLQLLQDFRVSDACPSWFLQGFAYLEHMESPDENWNWSSSAVSTLRSTPPAVLYCYKRLKPRPWLSPCTPSDEDVTSKDTATPTTKGCLWETVLPEETDDQFASEDPSVPIGEPSTPTVPQESLYRLQCPPYLSLEEEYGSHICDGLFSKEALEIFRSEALAIPRWTPWPETQHYSVGPNGETTWTVFPLCYCFPANDVQQRTWVDGTKTFCPQTCQLLERVLGNTLRTALFSQLNQNATLEAHTGWADLANHVLRLHIPLVVPTACGTWVDGCVETHEAGRPLLFDDSKIHRAFNYSNQGRIVLIVDLERPAHLPLGYAKGGHSSELDQFIAQMRLPK